MCTQPLICLVLLGTSILAVGQTAGTSTALEAVKLLPDDAAKSLVRIEAREGNPNPSRWHILVYDPKEENGLHEYVVVGKEIVASRALSQFAMSLTKDDVIGAEAIKLDSDRVGSVVQQFVKANSKKVAEMNFQLSRDGEGAAPIWKVTCVDATGKPLGSVAITAAKGTVVSHDGFPVEPAAEKEKRTERTSSPPNSRGEGSRPANVRKPAGDTQLTRGDTRRQNAPNEPPPVAEADPRRSEPGFFQRAGGSLQKIFTGREAPAR